MISRTLLLGPDLRDLTAEDFLDYVKSLYTKPESKSASLVDGVNITWGTRKIVRVSRSPKFVTAEEVSLLAKEYGVRVSEVWNLLKSRKIEIRLDESKLRRKR